MSARLDGLSRQRRAQQPQRQAKAKLTLGHWLVIVIVPAIIAAAYYWWPQLSSSSPVAPTTIDEPASSETPAFSSQDVIIDVYDSGAGAAAAADAVAKLEAAGLVARNLGESQLRYDNTYIWYRPELVSEASAAKAALGDTAAVTQSTKINGVFGILIYLGKK